MDDVVAVPEGHWRTDAVSAHWQSYVPGWERKLRASVETERDPAKRFELWLQDKAGAERTHFDNRGVRLVFFEQPYLAWAEAVEQIIALTESETRSVPPMRSRMMTKANRDSD
jgi:hypothetical protein